MYIYYNKIGIIYIYVYIKTIYYINVSVITGVINNKHCPINNPVNFSLFIYLIEVKSYFIYIKHIFRFILFLNS